MDEPRFSSRTRWSRRTKASTQTGPTTRRTPSWRSTLAAWRWPSSTRPPRPLIFRYVKRVERSDCLVGHIAFVMDTSPPHGDAHSPNRRGALRLVRCRPALAAVAEAGITAPAPAAAAAAAAASITVSSPFLPSAMGATAAASPTTRIATAAAAATGPGHALVHDQGAWVVLRDARPRRPLPPRALLRLDLTGPGRLRPRLSPANMTLLVAVSQWRRAYRGCTTDTGLPHTMSHHNGIVSRLYVSPIIVIYGSIQCNVLYGQAGTSVAACSSPAPGVPWR
jgi:hypothetical protein